MTNESIIRLQERIHENNKKANWWEGENLPLKPNDTKDLVTIAVKLGLIHTEVSEAFEEIRYSQEKFYYINSSTGKPEGLASELADIIIRTLDLAAACDIYLYNIIEEKLAFNKTRGTKYKNDTGKEKVL